MQNTFFFFVANFSILFKDLFPKGMNIVTEIYFQTPSIQELLFTDVPV